MKIIDCQQNSPEWHAARCGRVTASRVADIVRRTKSGVSACRETYLWEIISERISGAPQDSYTSREMQWGKDHEDEAAATYALLEDVRIEKVGLVIHPRIEMAAASPDRLAGEDGLLEIKCPNTNTHMKSVRFDRVDPDYEVQIQWQLACTGRKWCDFISYDPRMNPKDDSLPDLTFFKKRYARNPIVIAELEAAVVKFLAEVDQTIAELRQRYSRAAEAA